MAVKVLIYYGHRHDGGDNPYQGELSRPDLVPQMIDVQDVAIEDATYGWRRESSPEGYWLYRDGEWFASDVMGFWGYLHTPGIPKYCLFGRTLTAADWEAHQRRISDDFHIAKTGAPKRERRQDRG